MELQRIVVGVDFSDASLGVARWVAKTLAPDAELLLVHVVPEPDAPLYLRRYVGPTLAKLDALTQNLYSALKGFGDLLGANRVRVGVRMGNPATTLARVADEVNADMLCVGRGHLRQGGSRFGATTPQRLLAHACVPVMIAPPAIPDQLEKIVAAVDGRADDDRVLQTASALSRAWRTNLDALHVLESEVAPRPPSPDALRSLRLRSNPPLVSETRLVGIEALGDEGVRAIAEEWMTSRLATVAGARSQSVIRRGDPGPELVSHAQNNPGSLLVVGRGPDRSPAPMSASSFPSGSTTRYVVWSAPCPVLVLPAESESIARRVRTRLARQPHRMRLIDGSLAGLPPLMQARSALVRSDGDGGSAA